MDSLAQYPFDGNETQSTRYLWAAVRAITHQQRPPRIFELGCGNGGTAAQLSREGYSVTAVDTSEQAIEHARGRALDVEFHVGSAYDDLAATYGTFPCVISLEVVEHCFYPRKFAHTVFNLLDAGGVAIISTPFHGYWKNLMLAFLGKMDSHFGALWDGGHIKFWSPKTLHVLLAEAGFEQIHFQYVGRIRPFSKSMVAIARKP
jgi:2-polyprenyl-3-methyl-5-hydroxy-6-metoxy-1,4-benzoquinol methylase